MLPRILHTYYCVTTTYSPTGKTVRLTTVQTGDKPNSSYCLDGNAQRAGLPAQTDSA